MEGAAGGDSIGLRGSRPRVSVIVCTSGDRPHSLRRTLEGLTAAISASALPAELLVVDNSPGGGAVDLRDDPGMRVVRAGWPGLSHARRVACELSRGDILVFVDDDVDVPAGWLAPMVEPIASAAAEIVASRVDLSPALQALDLPRLCREWLAENSPAGDDVRVVGAGFAFTRDVLQIGLFDVDLGAGPSGFGYGEEHLFDMMCRSAGARAVYSSGPAVVHNADLGRVSVERFVAEARRKGASEAFIAHHWHGETMHRPLLRALKRASAARRARARMSGRLDESLVEAMNATVQAQFAVTMARLRREPRRYSPRRIDQVLRPQAGVRTGGRVPPAGRSRD